MKGRPAWTARRRVAGRRRQEVCVCVCVVVVGGGGPGVQAHVRVQAQDAQNACESSSRANGVCSNSAMMLQLPQQAQVNIEYC